jgi:hypothetical protein
MSARKDLKAALKPLLPRNWQIVTADKSLDEITKPALIISQRTITPAPNALGNHLVTFLLTVMDPRADEEAAEDALDNEVDDLLFAIDKTKGVWWTSAEKIVYQGKRAYQISLQAATERKEKYPWPRSQWTRSF